MLGTGRARHDLSQLELPLRSHGGISEQRVPIDAEPAQSKGIDPNRRWRNFDVFDLALESRAMSARDERARRPDP